MAFKDLYENAKKQGASTAALKKIDEDARRVLGVGVTDRVVPKAPVVPSVTIPQPTATPTVKQPEAAVPTTEEKEAPSKKDAAKTTMEQAVKAYDDYIKSDEHKQRLQEAENKAKLDAAAQATFGPGTNVSLTPQTIRDEKAEQLRAARDQAEEDYNRSLDEEVMAADQAAIADLTDEERSMLEQYAVNRIGDQNRTLEMQGIMPTAQQQAAALIQKYGQQRVDELAESFMRQQNADLNKTVEEKSRQFANEHGFWGSAFTVPVAAMNGLAGTLGHLQGAARRTGRYRTLDANETGTLGDVFTGAVRGQVQQNIEGEDPNLLRKAASVGYQGIMSMADSIARGYLGGGAIGAGVLAATSTFSQVMSEASRNGATPAQAAALATVNSAIEAATEAIPLDELIKTAKGQGAGTVLKNVLRNAGIEATAEELSLVGTFLAEAAIMQEQSGYQQEVRDLILGGMSPEAAREAANRNLLNEAANTLFVSGLSGGLSSVGASVADAKSIPTPPTLEQVADMMLGDLVKPKQEVQNQTNPMAQQGGGVTPETTVQTPQTQPVQAPQGGENAGNDVLMRTMELMVNNDGKLSNKAAENILRDQDKLRFIMEQTAADITGTKSEQRAKLKAAMEQMFQNQNTEANTQTATEAQAQAPQAVQQPEAAQPQVQTPQQQTPVQTPTMAREGSAPQADMQTALDTASPMPQEQSAEGGRNVDAIKELLDYIDRGVDRRWLRERSNAFLRQYEEIQKNKKYGEQYTAEESDRLKELHFLYSAYSSAAKDVNGTRAMYRSFIDDLENNNVSENVKYDRNGRNEFPNTEIKGTGAAEADFSAKPAYNATLSVENAQHDRRTDVRPMELPNMDINGGNVSATTANVYGSQNTPDDLASAMEEPVARGDYSYVKIPNDTATQRAQQTIAGAGSWETARDNFRMDVDRGNAGAELSARGALILNHAAEVYEQAKASGDMQAAQRAKMEWLTILSDVQKLGTNTAQGLQAMRIIRNLMPQDKIQFTRIAVQNMVRDLRLKNDIQVDEQLLTEYENATTDEQRDEIMERIQQNVADQIPSTMLDKWNALRYTNMLGNLKTTLRNIGGNVGNTFAYRVKDAVGATLEAIVNKATGGRTGRTKSVVVNRGLQKACGDFFKDVKNTVGAGGKYSGGTDTQSEFTQGVMDRRRIFKSNSKNDIVRKVSDLMWTPMEAYRKGTNWMMNNEYFGDEAFGKAAFTHAMAGYLQANGVKTAADLQNADPGLIDKAMAYAVKEAQETTFHDNSALANVLGRLKKDAGIIGEGILPFPKTPANVLTRAEEYSPIGIINTAVTAIQAANPNSDVTGADVINSLSKTLTGTGIFALGAIMQSQGLLTGGPDEDEEKAAFDKENGIQNYALVLPDGRTYTMDWLTPEAMPLFMGAALMEAASDKNLTFADMEQIFTSIADPMIQMSMMQGINQSLENIKYSDNNLIQFGINAAVSYLTQGLTNTLLGQMERDTEEYRQTTYVDKDSQIPAWMQRQLGSASQKIPGWDYQQMDYVDSFGQKQKNEGGLLYNLASPGYSAKTDIDAVDKELYRLNEAGVEGNVFPKKAPTSLTWTDKSGTVHKDYNLSAEEYQTYSQVRGETAKKILNEIYKKPSYASLTDEQKNDVREKAFEYAEEQAKKKVLPDYSNEEAGWIDEVNGDPTDEIILKAVASGFDSALGKKQTPEKMEAAYNAYKNLSPDQRKVFMDEAEGETKSFLIAKSVGMNETTFTEVYGNYETIRDDDGLETSDKALEWNHYLQKAKEQGLITEAQRKQLDDSMNFYYHIQVETPRYDDMIAEGIRSDTAANVARRMDDVVGTGANGAVRPIDTRAVVADAGLSDAETDRVMHAIMGDYDPNAAKKEYSELKYDYIRHGLGLTPQEYINTYRAYLDGASKAEDIQAIMKLGFDKEMATTLYNVYRSTNKGKAAYLGFYESRQG